MECMFERNWHNVFVYCIVVATTFSVAAQEINITAAQLNGGTTHTRTVVKVRLTWSQAAQYCIDSGLGVLYSGVGSYNILDLRHSMHTMQWPTGEDLWLGLIKPANETKWYAPSCFVYNSKTLENIMHPYILCLAINMTIDSTNFEPYMTNCEEEHYFVCTMKTGVYSADTYFNMTLLDPGGIHILTDSTYNTTETVCSINLKKGFPGFVAVYNKDVRSCVVYKTNPVYFRHNYELLPVTNHTTVYVKTSGHKYEVKDTLTKPVKQKIMNCVPLLNAAVEPNTTTIEPIVTGTSTSAYTCASQTTSLSTCLCQPTTHTVTGSLDFDTIIRSLKINKTDLSSYKRRLVSVPDDRTSCRVMGYVAAIVIFGSCSYIIMMDIPIIFRNIARKKLRACYTLPQVISGK